LTPREQRRAPDPSNRFPIVQNATLRRRDVSDCGAGRPPRPPTIRWRLAARRCAHARLARPSGFRDDGCSAGAGGDQRHGARTGSATGRRHAACRSTGNVSCTVRAWFLAVLTLPVVRLRGGITRQTWETFYCDANDQRAQPHRTTPAATQCQSPS
jgi:hypothetical protein